MGLRFGRINLRAVNSISPPGQCQCTGEHCCFQKQRLNWKYPRCARHGGAPPAGWAPCRAAPPGRFLRAFGCILPAFSGPITRKSSARRAHQLRSNGNLPMHRHLRAAFPAGVSSYCMSGEVVTAQNRTRGRLQNGFHPRDGVGFAWHWHAWITFVSNTQRWHQAASQVASMALSRFCARV